MSDCVCFEHGKAERVEMERRPEESVSISMDETSKLCPPTQRGQTGKSKLEHPGCSIVPPLDPHVLEAANRGLSTPPHTFLYSKMSSPAMADGDAFGGGQFEHLVDEEIECKFTVIGSPMLCDDDDDDVGHGADGGKGDHFGLGAASKAKRNVIWEFVSAGDLIKGLSGVQHSVSNPLWMDLVCDRFTFIQIAEVCDLWAPPWRAGLHFWCTLLFIFGVETQSVFFCVLL